MYFQSSKKFARHNFSLIELLIVIGIMGALAALILPAFSDTESAAKDTACDYNQAGTLRYLQMFHAANGVYPSGFHTGLQNNDAGTTTLRLVDGKGVAQEGSALTTCGDYNFTKGSAFEAIGAQGKESLDSAGIVNLAYGHDIAERITNESIVAVVKDTESANSYWTEAIDAASGEVNGSGDPLCFRNVPLYKISALGKADTADSFSKAELQFRANSATTPEGENQATTYTFTEPKFKIVPLYVAPTIDWTHYYKDGPNDSKVQISMAGKCPWGEGGQARYYIAFFKVYTAQDDDGNIPAAKLLCTSCPDCGILESDLF